MYPNPGTYEPVEAGPRQCVVAFVLESSLMGVSHLGVIKPLSNRSIGLGI